MVPPYWTAYLVFGVATQVEMPSGLLAYVAYLSQLTAPRYRARSAQDSASDSKPSRQVGLRGELQLVAQASILVLREASGAIAWPRLLASVLHDVWLDGGGHCS